MTHKTRKISVVVATIVAVLCMVVAILGFTGMPSKSVSAAEQTTPKTYYMISGAGQPDDWSWTTAEAPAESATKVTITFKIVSKSVAGRHFQLLATDGTEKVTSTLHGAYQFGSWFPEGGTVTFVADLTAKTYVVLGTDGKSELLDCTFNTSNKFGGIVYKGSGSVDVIGLYEIIAVDDTGKDLGITSSSASISVATEKPATVTFNAEGTETKRAVLIGEKASEIAAPAKDGYYFVGWFTEQTFENKFDFSTTISQDITLYAKYAQAVTYHMLTTSSHKDGMIWSTKEVPSEGATKVTVTVKIIARDIVGRHARVRVSEDGTTFTGNSLSGAVKWDDSYAPVGQTVIYIADLVNKSWGNKGTNGTSDVDTYNYTIDAKYFGVTIYKGNGGSTGVSGYYEITAVDDMGKDLGITSNDPTVIISTNEIHAVTLNANNGTEATKAYVEAGSTLTETTPLYDGYLFKGWFTDADLTTAYDFSQAVDQDLTLYAKWASLENVKSYDVTLNGEATVSTTKYYEARSRLSISEDATKVYIEYTLGNDDGAGHSFLYDKCAGTMVSAYTIDNLWTGAERFAQANSHVWGANNPALSAGSYKVIFDLVNNTMVWYRGTTEILRGTGTAFADATSFGFYTGTAAGEGTATFKIYDDMGKDLGVRSLEMQDLTIECPKATFDVNYDGGENVVVDVQKATISALTDVSREGYKFDGWYNEAACETEFDFTKEITGDITLYAKWVDFETYYAGLLSTGAPSIRVEETTTSGIRFATTVNTELLAELAQEGYAYTLGTLIVPFDYVGDVAPTMEWLDANGRGYYNLVSTYDGTKTAYYGTLKSLKVENYGRKWVGLGYVAIDMGDDTVKYIYAEYDANNAKSIYDVAETFYNNYKDDENEIENVEVAKFYIDSVVVLNAEYQVVEKVTGTELPYEVVINENVVTITVKADVEFVVKSVVINGKIAKVVIAEDGKSATYQIA